MKNYEQTGLTDGYVTFRFVESEAEYGQVLALRFREYSAAGKVAPGKSPADMGDSFDRRSKIIVGIYQGEIVASIRMIIHKTTDLLEQEQFIEWPQRAPRRTDLVEATRACIRRDFRGSDLFLRMLTFYGQEAMKMQKKYVVLCASDEMVGFYRKAGAFPLGLSYAHRDLNGKIHHVLVVDIHQVFLGRGVNPLVWNLTWGRLYADSRNRIGIRITALDHLRLAAYSLMLPLAHLSLRRRLKKKSILVRRWQRSPRTVRKLVHESA